MMSVSGSSHRFAQCLCYECLDRLHSARAGSHTWVGLGRSLLAQRLLAHGLSREIPVDDLRHFVEIVVCINRMSI